jgi:hypothetical protein
VRPTSLRLVRLRAHAPRAIVLGCLIVLAALGARVAVAGPPPAPPAPRLDPALFPHAEEDALAEAFARAYASWDAERPEEHERAVQTLAPELEPGGGVGLPPSGRGRVTWTAPVAFARVRARESVVTVALGEEGRSGLRYLAVPVVRDAAGAPAIAGYPAWVGAPPIGRAGAPSLGDPIEDAALRRVLARFLANYLRGARENAGADLLPGTRLALPGEHLKLDELLELTHAGRDAVRVVLTARARDGVLHTLTYELRIARRERPYVAGLLSTPVPRPNGATP